LKLSGSGGFCLFCRCRARPKLRSVCCRLVLGLLAAVLVLVLPAGSSAGDVGKSVASGNVPEHWGLGLTFGNTYKPTTRTQYIQLSGFALVNPQDIWPHVRLGWLRYKVGCTAGITTRPKVRGMASAGLILLYYISHFADGHFRPYAEFGCHVIYNDFRVPGQGLRVNFCPQGGLGAEFTIGSGPTFYATIKLEHMSNGGLRPQNAGINSVVLTVGRLF